MSAMSRFQSVLLLLLFASPALAATQSFQLLTPSTTPPSVTAAGDSTAPVLSGNGNLAVFLSTADDLVTNDHNAGKMDVFVRPVPGGETQLVSVGLDGTSTEGPASMATLSANGRFVVFVSNAGNLVANDLNSVADVFVRDLHAGTTRLVSAALSGAGGNAESGNPCVSDDGRWIAFESYADDLVSNDTNGVPDVFLFDQETGITTRLSSPSDLRGLSGNPTGPSSRPVISADGSTAMFVSQALNLAPGIASGAFVHTNRLYLQRPVGNTNRMVHLFQPDPISALIVNPLAFSLSTDGRYVAVQATERSNRMPPGVYWADVETDTFARVAPLLTTTTLSGQPELGGPFVSADGQTVIFEARADAGDGTTRAVVYAWNAQTLETVRISSGGLTNAPGSDPSTAVEAPFGELVGASPDAEFIAFIGGSPDDPPTAAPARQLVVRQRSTGVLRRVSRRPDGDRVESVDYPAVAFSADGKRLAFQCPSGELVTGDDNRSYDVFLYDWDSDTLELLSARHESRRTATSLSAPPFGAPTLSANGHTLAFASEDPSRVPDDANDAADVFVRDLGTGELTLVSVNQQGAGTGNRASTHPLLSPDGRRIAFLSLASDLVANDTNGVSDLFVRDLDANSTLKVGSAGSDPAWSPDGAWLAFEGNSEASSWRQVYALELATGQLTLISKQGSTNLPGDRDSAAPRFSADSRFVIFVSYAANLLESALTSRGCPFAYEIRTGELRLLSADNRFTSWASALSAWRIPHPVATDAIGRYVVFARSADLAIHDLQTGETTSLAPGASNPSMSADGWQVAYEGLNAPGGFRQVLVTDRRSGQTLNASIGSDGIQSGNGHSSSSMMTLDGRFVVFASQADNLVESDTNHATDLFIRDRVERQTLLVSANPAGLAGHGLSTAPVLAADGRTLVFSSFADDLVDNDLNRNQDLFLLQMPGAESGIRIFTLTQPNANGTTIIWAAEFGKNYQLEYTDDPSALNWQPLDTPIRISGGQGTAEDPTVSGSTRRFYRITEAL